MRNPWVEWISNAAGFFNGEGYTGASRRGLHVGLSLTVSQAERDVLDTFRDSLGLGAVSGPYLPPTSQKRGNEQPRFYYQVARFEYVQAAIAMMWPWLSRVKRAQARLALLAVRDRPSHQRTCRNGHPRTPENQYLEKAHPKWRICRLCKADNIRAYRARNPERRRAYEHSEHRRAYHKQWQRNKRWAEMVTSAALRSLPWVEAA